MLRASFRLAPWSTDKPLDFPVIKTRDASNRLLPLERRFVYPYSRVPGSLPRLAPCGGFPDFGIRKALTGEGDVSRRPPSLRRIAFRHTFFLPRVPRLSVSKLGRGRCFSPTVLGAINLLTPLSPPLLVSASSDLRPNVPRFFVSCFFARSEYGRSCQDHRDHFLVKGRGS